MKILLPVFIFFLIAIPVFSQKQFEGTIVYLFKPEGEKGMQMTVSFGKNAIKLKLEDDNAVKLKFDDRNEVILIRIDSGKLYKMNMGAKIYTVRKLHEREIPPAIPARKDILGYSTTAVNATGNSAISMLTLMFRSQQATFYVADSLLYPVPEKYILNLELAFIHEGKIILGTEIKPAGFYPEDTDDSTSQKQEEMPIVIKATSVKWETISDAELSVPPDFTKLDYPGFAFDSTAVADTTVLIDTAIRQLQEKPAKTPAGRSKKPATPSKKTNNQPTGAIRKPE